MAVGLVATTAVAFSALTAAASPESDAQDAINAAWQAAGGDTSPLGAAQGGAYPVGAGFAENFAGGKVFFTPETGARAMYGAILDTYESHGGAADGDLGFPNSDEVPGLVSPDSRVTMFSAADKPVIFWTPEHGAHVVRGPVNAGWDKLGSSTGPLGVPAGDETYDGPVISQKFSGGELSWNSQTKAFATVPPQLAEQLSDLQVSLDPGAAINHAWRAAGGASGPLGAKQGGQYQVGNDGAGQDFAGGKIYFGPATGASAVEGDILAKYESLGGPAGSDLGFPVSSETDGDIPGSRVTTFSGSDPLDKPVIFFTPENGAFVVRGVMKVAWDQLGGAAAKIGAPVGDQSVDGDVVAQKFSGGQLSWNRATNTLGAEPGELAQSLSGLHIPGVNLAKPGAAPSHSFGKHGWHWWWLGVPIVVLAAAAVVAGALLSRRRPAPVVDEHTVVPNAPVPPGEDDDADTDGQWSATNAETESTVRLPAQYGPGADDEASAVDLLSRTDSDDVWSSDAGAAPEDLDADTAPTRIPTETDLGTGRHAAIRPEIDADDELSSAPVQPTMHLPLNDPYEVPEGYPVKASLGSGLYYTADSARYDDAFAEIWFASEEAAELNGFVKAR